MDDAAKLRRLAEMNAGRRAVARAIRREFMDRWTSNGKLRITWLSDEVVVRVRGDARYSDDSDLILREPRDEFPSETMVAKLRLVLG